MAKRFVSSEQLRAWCGSRQGLDGSLDGAAPETVLTRSGWMRSVGGSSPYLCLHARAGLSRTRVDAAVESVAICELPSARGCTYVIPASDYPVALRAGQGHGGMAELRMAKKSLGVTDQEIDRLCQAVLDGVARGPADPKDLKDRLGDRVRHLGDAGKKRGLTTTLPIALGLLQSKGEIRRVPVNGRIDQQRYQYALWRPGPLAGVELSGEALALELGRRFFRWAAPATPAQLAWWGGLSAKAAQSVAAELKVVPLDAGEERLLFPDDLDALRSFRPSQEPNYSLVGSLDNLFHLRREIATTLDDADGDRTVQGEKKLEPLHGLSDLPHHAIVDRGRLIGLWDYDAESQTIAWSAFGKATRDLEKAIARTEAFVRDDLGDARSFSLDSPASRKGRIASLRKSK